MRNFAAAVLLLLICVPAPAAGESTSAELEEITVTATKTPRKVEEVTAATEIVRKEEVEASRGNNIGESLRALPGIQAESSNGAYDTHIIIRGAGAKAAYGVREIKIMVDGIPITDPDSLTRLDMVDSSLVERIEVVKGPNSTLYGANAAGGVINIITKSPFENPGITLKAGYGSYNSQDYHLQYAGSAGQVSYLLAATRRSTDSWRDWNEFETNQFNGRFAWMIDDTSDMELSLSYTTADLQLPGRLTKAQFDEDPSQQTLEWAHTGRDSTVARQALSYRKESRGGAEFKGQVYAQEWEHYHPVPIRINDGGADVFGADLQENVPLELFGRKHLLSAGLSAQRDDRDTRAYTYRDLVTTTVNGQTVVAPPYSRSDAEGDLAETSRNTVDSWGVFLQDSVRVTDGTILDLGMRFDRVRFSIDSAVFREWAFVTAQQGVPYFAYRPVDDTIAVDKTWDAWSPRLGLNQALSPEINVFGAVATGFQTPTQSEIESNENLDPQRSLNYEIGLKGHFRNDHRLDLTLFSTTVKNEVVPLMDEYGATIYDNAGRTRHRGAELSGQLKLAPHLAFQANYTYSDFTFEDYQEAERVGYPAKTVLISRDGNDLPLVPRHKYSFALSYLHPDGFSARIGTVTWGRYYVDTANTETYGGFTTANCRVGYDAGRFGGYLAVDNLFDRKYAAEVTKSYGRTGYAPAAPRIVSAGVSVRF